MPVTSTDIVNQALWMIGDNTPPVTGVAPTFDSSTSGVMAAKLYDPCVATVARQFGWDFARKTVALQPSGVTAPIPWNFQYLYPTNGIEVYGLIDPTRDNLNDPAPNNFDVANDVVAEVQIKVINTNLNDAIAVYNNNPAEEIWDAGFREAVVRLLASEFALAGAGKPDVAAAYLQSYNGFSQLAQTRRD